LRKGSHMWALNRTSGCTRWGSASTAPYQKTLAPTPGKKAGEWLIRKRDKRSKRRITCNAILRGVDETARPERGLMEKKVKTMGVTMSGVPAGNSDDAIGYFLTPSGAEKEGNMPRKGLLRAAPLRT